MPKDFDHGLPTVFVFDQQSLRSRYLIEPYKYPPPEDNSGEKFEMEERTWLRDIQPMSRHLSAIVFCVFDRVYTSTSKADYNRVYKPITTECASDYATTG